MECMPENAKVLARWISAGHAAPAPQSVRLLLHDYLGKLPRQGHGLDASRIPHSMLYLPRNGIDRGTVDWFRSTPLGRCEKVLLFLGIHMPCVACTPTFAIRNLQLPEAHRFRRLQIVGARHDPARPIEPLTQHFGEYDGWDAIWTTL